MKPLQRASVCGLGKLGACIAATLAQRGFEVVGIDIDPEKVQQDQRGPAAGRGAAPGRRPSPRAVPGCAPRRITAKRWPRTSPSSSRLRRACRTGASRTNSCCARCSPSRRRCARRAKRAICLCAARPRPPGAVDTVLIPMLERETGGVCGRDFGVCYNPEFIALGNVVKGLLEPDMVLIGESDPESGAALEELYKQVQPQQAAHCPHVHRQRRADQDLGEQLHHDEDQLHQPVADDRRAVPQGQYPPDPGGHRQRQPHRPEVSARRPELRRAVLPARQPPAGLHRTANRPGGAARGSLRPREPGDQCQTCSRRCRTW